MMDWPLVVQTDFSRPAAPISAIVAGEPNRWTGVRAVPLFAFHRQVMPCQVM
jgi:hypothetical protein